MLLKQYKHKLNQDFTVYGVSSAQAALDVLDNEHLKMDVVIMDVNIGQNNGIELLHELRSYDDWINMPIIMLSSVPPGRVQAAKLHRYGLSKFLYKPQTPPRELSIQTKRVLAVGV